MSRLRPAELHRLVAAIAAIGLLLQGVVGVAVAGSGPVAMATLPGSIQPWSGAPLLLLLLALTCLGDLVAVRLRHGGQTEELTLFEAAVVVDVLLLPAVQALLVPVAASVLCSLLHRRAPLKAVFNLANLAAATAVLVGVVHLLAGPGAGLSARTVVALALGTLAFTAFNLVAVSRVIALAGGGSARDVVREGYRLSAVMAIGTVALGGTVVVVTAHAPALLPFTVMPAAALTFAYRAAAQESDERERSGRLLALSQVLAGRLDAQELLASFLDLSRQAFGADLALAVLDPAAAPGSTGPVAVADDAQDGRSRRTAGELEQLMLLKAATGGAAALERELPPGWTSALLAPLEAEGRRLGALVLVSRDRHRRVTARELPLVTSLASALAAALRGAAHVDKLVEETSKLKAVVEQSSDGILVLDGHGRVQLWSPALTMLSGRPELAALGRPLGELLDTLDEAGAPVDAFQAGRQLLSPERPQGTTELVVRRDDGEQRVVRLNHAGAFDGDALVRDVVIVHDVTRQRQVERLKADFIATVSHELRTPVTPIKGYADLLRRRGDRMSPDKRQECLDVISDRADHLARLVEDLLLASRISATEGSTPTTMDMGHDDLGSLVRQVCGDAGADSSRIALRLPDEPVVVACDAVRVVQVLTNLVGNALKYSAAASPVSVALLVADDTVRVEVTDSGRGIPADQLERVFEKFHRVEDPLRMTTGGTGLGLYIARQLTTAMGGRLSCTSTLGAGSVFTFSLPLPVRPSRPGRPAPFWVPSPAPTAALPGTGTLGR